MFFNVHPAHISLLVCCIFSENPQKGSDKRTNIPQSEIERGGLNPAASAMVMSCRFFKPPNCNYKCQQGAEERVELNTCTLQKCNIHAVQ